MRYTMTPYEQGFIEKCAAAGVDPEELIKFAQWSALYNGLGRGLGAPSSPVGLINAAPDKNTLQKGWLGAQKAGWNAVGRAADTVANPFGKRSAIPGVQAVHQLGNWGNKAMNWLGGLGSNIPGGSSPMGLGSSIFSSHR